MWWTFFSEVLLAVATILAFVSGGLIWTVLR